MLVPVTTWPNERLEGAAIRKRLVAPEPARRSCKFEVDPSMVNVAVLRIRPNAAGANVIFRAMLCPGARTAGRVRPVTANAGSPTSIAEIVALVPPVFVKTVSCVSA